VSGGLPVLQAASTPSTRAASRSEDRVIVTSSFAG
jgi:hypothetical protein